MDNYIEYHCVYIPRSFGELLLVDMNYKIISIEENLIEGDNGTIYKTTTYGSNLKLTKIFHRYRDVLDNIDMFKFRKAGGYYYNNVTIYYDKNKFTDDMKNDPLKWSGQYLLKNYYNKLLKSDNSNKNAILTTEDETMSKQPPLFLLPLKDYQRQELTWMLRIENTPDLEFEYEDSTYVKFPNTNYYMNKIDNTIWLNQYNKKNKLRINGGVLANKMGLGKTVTTIALISINKCEYIIPKIPDGYRENEYLIPSCATLIICPTHLCSQWQSECKKFTGNKLKILKIVSRKDIRNLLIKDICKADIVITSYKYIKNLIVFKDNRWKDYLKKYIYSGTKEELAKYVDCNLAYFWWHRIVYDEYHEEIARFDPERCKMHQILIEIKSSTYWGLSGTPKFDNVSMIQNTMRLLHHKPKIINDDINNAFLKNFVRKNTKLDLPPLIEEIVYIDQTEQEKLLYRSKEYHYSRSELLKLCSHHYIGEHSDVFKQKTIDQICNSIKSGQLYELDKLNLEYTKKMADLGVIDKLIDEKTRKNINVSGYIKLDRKRTHDAMKKLKIRINKIQSSLSFYEKTILEIKKNKIDNIVVDDSDDEAIVNDNDCPICFDEINDLVITPCGHKFCSTCMIACFNNNNESTCPHCRERIRRNDIVVIKDEIIDESVDNLYTKYGSKIKSIITKIRNTNGKIIILAQWDKLLHRIGDALSEMNIKGVYIKGNIYQRDNMITNFKNDPNTKCILLSVEYIGSGLNLIEANNVFITHPFISDNAKEKELQGIGRSYRTGQTKQVTITRFITKNTIEEEIYKLINEPNPEIVDDNIY